MKSREQTQSIKAVNHTQSITFVRFIGLHAKKHIKLQFSKMTTIRDANNVFCMKTIFFRLQSQLNFIKSIPDPILNFYVEIIEHQS